MAAPTPRMHGLTHAQGGPDPIPGLGAGGGALEWEDVGASSPYVLGRTDAIHARAHLDQINSDAPDIGPLWPLVLDENTGGFALLPDGSGRPARYLQITQGGLYLVAFSGEVYPGGATAGPVKGGATVGNPLGSLGAVYSTNWSNIVSPGDHHYWSHSFLCVFPFGTVSEFKDRVGITWGVQTGVAHMNGSLTVARVSEYTLT